MNSMTRTLATMAAVALACTTLAVAPPASTPALAAPPAGYTHPANACQLTVIGGVEGRDYYYATDTWTRNPGNAVTSTLNKLVICSSAPMTISNTGDPAMAVDATIFVEAGTQANLTFDGVNISSHVPFTLERNRDEAGNSIEPKTSAHIALAAGSTNTLVSPAGSYAPGMRCGEDTSLTIDDDVPNVDVNGAPIDVAGGRIKAGTVYVDKDGTTRTATANGPDANISNLESDNPGALNVTGGYLCAAIGGSDWETTGEMTFNGGTIKARATGDSTYGFGAGIGGSHGGHGTTPDTWITFNGGTVTAYASYHGAAIGGGGPSYQTAGSTTRENNYRFPDAKLSDRQPGSGFGANAGTPVHSKVCAGNLQFNGGIITPISADHGNAIGQGCFCWNIGRKIVITGGTLLPDTSRQDSGYGYAHAIGALGGEVYVTGGSVRIGTVKHDNGRTTEEKYQAYIGDPIDPDHLPSDFYTNYSQKTAYGSLDKSTQVMMRTIKVPGTLGANANITAFDMTVNGVAYPYGAPRSTDESGNLYLWLPTTTEGEVRVNLTAVDRGGNVVKTEPYYMDDVQHGGDHLKQFVIFSIDPQKVPTLKNLTKRYDGLPWGKDVSGKLLSEVAQQAVEVDNPPVPAGLDKNKLDKADSMTMESQRLATDKDGNLIQRADTTDPSNIYEVDTDSGITQGFNANVGKYKLTISSNQYAQEAGFTESFYGHRCYYDYAEITPADTQTNLQVERVGDTATVRLTAAVTPRHDAQVKEATTCEAPAGAVQFAINGTPVGTPVPVIDQGEDPDKLRDGYQQSIATLEVAPETYRPLLINPQDTLAGEDAQGRTALRRATLGVADLDSSVPFGRQRVTAQFIPAEKGNYTDSNTASNEDFFVAVDPEWWDYEKVYDGSPAFPQLNGSHILGFVPAGFDVSLAYDPAQVTYHPQGANAGTHPITLKNTELKGADADKVILLGYTRGQDLVLQGTVTPKDVTITAVPSVPKAPAYKPYEGSFSAAGELVGDETPEKVLGEVAWDLGALDSANPAPGVYKVTPKPATLADVEANEDGTYTLGNYRYTFEPAFVTVQKSPVPVRAGQISTCAQDVVAGDPMDVTETLDANPVETTRTYFKRVDGRWELVAGEPNEPGTYLVISTGALPDGTPALPGNDIFNVVDPNGADGGPADPPAPSPGASKQPVLVGAEDILEGGDPRITDLGAQDEPVEVTHAFLMQDPLDPTHWIPVDKPGEPGIYLVVSTPTDPSGPYGPGSSVFVVSPAPAPPAEKNTPHLQITDIEVVDGAPRPRVEVDGEPFNEASNPEGRHLEVSYYRRNEDGTLTHLDAAPTTPGNYRVVVRLFDRDNNLLAETYCDFSLPLAGSKVIPATGDVASAAGLLGGVGAGLGAALSLGAILSSRKRRG